MSDYEKLCERIVLADGRKELLEIQKDMMEAIVLDSEYEMLMDELTRKWERFDDKD